jgi:hypothetical protein
MAFVWRLIVNPLAIDDCVRRHCSSVQTLAAVLMNCWLLGALLSARITSAGEPFQDLLDYFTQFGVFSIILTLLFLPVVYGVASSVGVPFRGRKVQCESTWHRLVLLTPISFVPSLVWMACAMIDATTDAGFGLYGMGKPAWIHWRGWAVGGSLPVLGLIVAGVVLHAYAAMHRLKRSGDWQRVDRCVACGYRLTGLTSGCCPECGTAFKEGRTS